MRQKPYTVEILHREEYPTEAEALAAARKLADRHDLPATVWMISSEEYEEVNTVRPKARKAA